MKSREEQRQEILKKLWWMKKDQENGLRRAAYEREKIFAYHTLVDLKRAIRKAMDIHPISCEKMMGTSWQYVINHFTYSDADNAKVETVIRRMEEQGFIKLLPQNGWTAVVVLKTK